MGNEGGETLFQNNQKNIEIRCDSRFHHWYGYRLLIVCTFDDRLIVEIEYVTDLEFLAPLQSAVLKIHFDGRVAIPIEYCDMRASGFVSVCSNKNTSAYRTAIGGRNKF